MHTVLRLWTRAEPRGPVEPRAAIRLVAGEGIEGDHARGGTRHVTILFAEDWEAAVADLGRPVDPAARRANVLVTGGRAGAYLGRRLRLGETAVEIRGVVAPCRRMDEAAPGLRATLEPDARAGIWGVVVEGGTVRVGDALVATDA